jgi:hypothetical protein
MKQGFVRMACGLTWLVAVAFPAQAEIPAEKAVCTDAPRTQWLSEAKIRTIFGEKNFTLVKLKISRGNCYEFYAVHHDGSVVEAYYHPVSGEVVRYNRVVVQGAGPASTAASASASSPAR